MINRFIALSILVHAIFAGALMLYLPATRFPIKIPVLDVSFASSQRSIPQILAPGPEHADIPSSPPVSQPKKSVSDKLTLIPNMTVDIASTAETVAARFHGATTAMFSSVLLQTEDKLEKPTTPPKTNDLAAISGNINTDINEDIGDTQRANHLISELRKALDHHFIYPPLARRHGWQGMVHVGLRLDIRGQLGALRVVRSSGYAILDNDAIKTLQRVESIPQARIWLGGRPFETELTVIYRLIGG